MDRVQGQRLRAGRNDTELGIYLGKEIIEAMGLRKDQAIVVKTSKKKKQIIIQL